MKTPGQGRSEGKEYKMLVLPMFSASSVENRSDLNVIKECLHGSSSDWA